MKETMRLLGRTIVFFYVWIVIAPLVPLRYCITQEFAQHNFLWKILYLNMAVTLERTKYYSGWTLSEAGMAITGLSYSGKDGSVLKWDLIIQS